MNLSDRINNLSESQTIAMTQKSRELKAKGFDIIPLSLGEPDFDTPDFIKDAAKKAIDENYTKYMPVPGYVDLREAISEKLKRDNNLNYSASQIVVSTGAKQSIANVCLSLLNPGDEVLVPAPYWVTYHEIIKLAEAVPVIIPTTIETDFKVTSGQLSSYITDKTKMMIYSSPCNPSGSVYQNHELQSIAEMLTDYPSITVLADEIYELINFSGAHCSMAKYLYDQTITVNGVSKGFAMTGWRIGYMAAPQWIADGCVKMQGQFTSGSCGIAQRAALAAVEANPNCTINMLEAFKKRRDMVLGMLNEIPGMITNVPEGAFYVFPDISAYFGKRSDTDKIENATDLCMYLLNSANVAVVTGEAFGAPNNIRISYAASDLQLRKAMNQIKEALAKLK